MNEKVLFIDDDTDCLALVEKILNTEGYTVFLAANGTEGLQIAYEQHPDLIILDISLPEHNGFAVCASLREVTQVPIVMLTARHAQSDITHGFAVGADDYIKKPFVNQELLSRIKALLRRGKYPDSANGSTGITEYTDEKLKIDLINRYCTVEGNIIGLTATEFNLLAALVRHPNRMLSYRTLLTEVWGDGYSHDNGILSLYIHQLRQKLRDGESGHKYIQTQWGRGYWFNPMPRTIQNVHPLDDGTPQVSGRKTIGFNHNAGKWIAAIVLLALLTTQINNIRNMLSGPAKGGAALQALMTAEGFYENDNAGVQGHVCVTNTGDASTENLAIVSNIQAISRNHTNIVSTSIDLDGKPAINPKETHCYPYKITFKNSFENETQHKILISITITNYQGIQPENSQCSGENLCSFGPSLTADFNLTKP